ncbi:twin-arginine translocation pathway signal [Microseira wollei NIES-4236]|uniref:Twin-arginine translocation pathway signal n=2 Tax=Microseira wollei TaxID=467598 RepID=A0AAV3X838_9CYAN|nr:twin-arginine translocation pathway signal [Microseira wollei NIES-4236]
MTDNVFVHGVASGDPLEDRVVIWTRVTTPTPEPVEVNWKIASDSNLSNIIASGTALAQADADYTVNVDVTGLAPASRYFYQFEALGQTSPVGRTKTLPTNGVGHLRFAQVSCAKFNAGFFNAYSCIAARDDLDFLLHLGDYIYEASNKPPASQTPGADIGRPFDPLHECKTLADYRRRYAQYRRDPDVQRLHAALPLIATLDDHEFADGAWRDGASEHKPERDGDWASRRAIAFQVRWEWLPARKPDPQDPQRVFRKVSLGGLADLILIDTRTRRDEPVPPPAMFDPARSALGAEQRTWLLEQFDTSNAQWKLLANPSVMATTWSKDFPPTIKQALLKLKLIDVDGIGPDYDQWDGYPVERDLLLNHWRDNQIKNVVVLSGDVHVGLAIELKRDAFDQTEEPIAVEFVTGSLTSQNLDDKMGWAARTQSIPIEQEVMKAFPHMRWCDFDSHGYVIIDVTSERVTAQWWAVDTVLRPSNNETCMAVWAVESGKPKLTQG